MITNNMPELEGDPLDFFKENEELLSKNEDEKEESAIYGDALRLTLSIIVGLFILGLIPCICYCCCRRRKKLRVEEKAEKRQVNYI